MPCPVSNTGIVKKLFFFFSVRICIVGFVILVFFVLMSHLKGKASVHHKQQINFSSGSSHWQHNRPDLCFDTTLRLWLSSTSQCQQLRHQLLIPLEVLTRPNHLTQLHRCLNYPTLFISLLFLSGDDH